MSIRLIRVALTFVLIGSPAVASAVDSDLANYKSASEAYAQTVNSAKVMGRMPTFSDPEAAKFLTILTDHRRFFGISKPEVKDLETVIDVCVLADKNMLAYFYLGLGADSGSAIREAATKSEASTRRLVERNVVTYQREVAPLAVFRTRCAGTMLTLLGDFFATAKPGGLGSRQRGAFEQIRRGALGSFLGMTQSAATKMLDSANRQAILASTAEMSTSHAEALDLPTRRQVREELIALKGSVDKEFHGQLQVMIDAMGSQRCQKLCLL